MMLLNRVRHALSLVAVPWLAAAPALAAQASPLQGIDAEVARAMRAFEVPGLAVAVVKDGRVLLAKGYGVRELGKPEPVDENTVFQIASNTKAFTTAALGMLVDEGKLHWDDRVIDYLPWFRLYDPYVTREFTIRDLLTHRSGLGLGAGDLLWLNSDYGRQEIVRRLRAVPPATSFRSAYAYDNVLYIAAGEVVAAASGTSWDDFIRDRIFAPLGMRTASTSVRAFRPGDNVAVPHARIDGTLQVVARDTVDNIGPAGAVNANVAELAVWMRTQLDSGRIAGTDRRLWTAARTRDFWTGVTIMPIGSAAPELKAYQPNFAEYGLGWNLRDYRGRKLVTHTGGLSGMTSRTLLVPSERIGIVVLTNSESPASTALAWTILDRLLRAPATDWIGGFRAAQRREEQEAADVERKAQAARAASSRPSLPLERYAGRYEDAMYGEATITTEAGRLVLRFRHSPAFTADLEHWQYDTFVARWRRANIPDAYVTFSLNPDGSIASFRMAAVSPLADFSYDYQDLRFVPAPAASAAER
ncbi:MAG: serine hydrolase [Gemmatimonadetes bacterium]|nr:serine hydrolase [Gemmatimonadota bacterium]